MILLAPASHPLEKAHCVALPSCSPLDPRSVATFFSHLSEDDMRSLAAGAKALRNEPPQAMSKALREFVDSLGGFETDMLAGDGLLKDLLAEALGIDVAERAFAEDRPPAPPDEILGPLLAAEPEDLALLLAHEKPQTVALLL